MSNLPLSPSGKKGGQTGRRAINIEPSVFVSEHALLIQQTLRSGQSVSHPGNLVILGDVHPGAEVTAAGSIYIMGTLRGLAHAGATGDEGAVVLAFRLIPTQLRIAGRISRAPDADADKPDEPEIARIRNGLIVIEPYLNLSKRKSV